MKLEAVYAALDSLLDYAKNCGLLDALDETFARNALLAELKLESYEKQTAHYDFPACLNLLCDYAAEQGLIARHDRRARSFRHAPHGLPYAATVGSRAKIPELVSGKTESGYRLLL